MRRFRFSLERVLEWRRLEEDAEAARLAALLEEARRLERDGAELEAQAGRVAAAIRDLALGRARLDGRDLAVLDSFSDWVRHRREELSLRKEELRGRIEAQRRRVLAARRKVRVLEKLEDRARRQWERDYDREIEQLAAESHLARWRPQAATEPRRRSMPGGSPKRPGTSGDRG